MLLWRVSSRPMTATMPQLVDTLIEDARWRVLGLDELAEHSADALMAELGLPAEGFEISLLACNDARIAALNADFRGKPQPTNVLSWPAEERGADEDGGIPDYPSAGSEDMPEELGDIAIAWETCEREADALGKPMKEHVTHLIVHGVLHLLGYDHIREKDAVLMEATESRALARLGIADPYG